MQNLYKQHLIEAYNRKAADRDASQPSEWKTKERDAFVKQLHRQNVKRILEIGAGTGKDSFYFKDQGFNIVSTDLSPEMVKLCKKKGLDARVMDFTNLDFPNETFDVVWALNCLLHVPKNSIKIVLSEIKRVLKPSGIFYMGVYGGQNSEGIWEEDTYSPKRFFSFYEDDAIKELLKQFFTIEYFQIVPKEVVGGNFHFQSMMMRK